MSRTWAWQRWFGGPKQSRHHGNSRRRRSSSPSRLRLETLEVRSLLTAAATASFTVSNDWTSGFQAEMQLANQQPTGVSNWQLEFDMARDITSIWNARIVSHVGNHYVIAGAAWNNNLAGGGNVSFGFVASGSGVGSSPTNYLLNGVPLGGSPPADLPSLSIGDVSKVEGHSGQTSFVFDVSLSAPSNQAVTVNYGTANGTAAAGSDYQATSGTLTFAPGQTQQQITVAVNGDTTYEADESFAVNLSSAAGATLAKAQATGTITNDDTQPTSGNFQFQITSDWGSGFTGQITAKNTTSQTLNNWRLEFDFGASITTIWNASIESHVGNHYVITGASWNSTIAPGGSVSFGFNGSPGGAIAEPSNFVWSGAGSGSGNGGGTGTNRAPTPAGDNVFVLTGQAIAINVLGNDTDPDGDRLTVTGVTQPANGATTLNADGTVSYTPRAGFTGSDNFSYTVSDGRGLSATAAVAITVGELAAPSSWEAQYYAPYVDMTLYPYYNIATAAQTQGIKYFSLGFITADSRQLPAWGGYTEYEISGTEFDLQVRQQVAAVRAAGGDVMVSFGGAANQELAEVITNVSQLTAAYQSVVDAYGLTHIDFDIEGAALAHRASVDRRSQAIATLQQAANAAGRTLEVHFTLPVLPTGLTPDGIYLLESALRNGVQISGVNIMAMDYGDSAAPNPQGRMGDYAIQAATSLFNQLKTLYGTAQTDAQLWHLVGVTPMIGLNDVTTEVFDQAAAQQLVTFAQQKGIGRISMWSLNRDTQGTPKSYVDNTSSSIAQTAYEFSQIFAAI
ncbi:MAG: cellulose binding domain-containing protein [Pirellulales bacterium]